MYLQGLCVELLIPITCLTYKLNSIFFALLSRPMYYVHRQLSATARQFFIHHIHLFLEIELFYSCINQFYYYFYFLFYVLFYVLMSALFISPPPPPPPSLSKSIDVYNETTINPTNYKIKISFSNILHICVFILGIIILLWFSYLYTICNHARYVCFTTNLSLLSKKQTLIPSQFFLRILSLLILGLLFEIEKDLILVFIIRTNLEFYFTYFLNSKR